MVILSLFRDELPFSRGSDWTSLFLVIRTMRPHDRTSGMSSVSRELR